jgi:carboxymethylenebutenolidase
MKLHARTARFAFILGLAIFLFASAPQLGFADDAELVPVEVSFQSGNLTLRGFLYKPEGDGPFPAILWNHGSEKQPGELPEVAPDVVAHGFVLFIPHRRGQGLSPGPYIMDEVNRASDIGGRGERDKTLVAGMRTHFEDQVAAMTYLQALPFVDTKRIAVMGCSFGGIQTVLMAHRGMGARAAVDFAGAAQTWGKYPQLREMMTDAVEHAQMPVFFVQAENDYDTAPSKDLAAAMDQAHKDHSIQIFPKFGRNNQDAHDFCVHGEGIWGTPVFAFITKAFQQ